MLEISDFRAQPGPWPGTFYGIVRRAMLRHFCKFPPLRGIFERKATTQKALTLSCQQGLTHTVNTSSKSEQCMSKQRQQCTIVCTERSIRLDPTYTCLFPHVAGEDMKHFQR